MPRKTVAPRSRPNKTRSPAISLPRLSIVRTAVGKLRDLAIGLGLVSALSFVPASLVQQWPTHAQTAVAISQDIRVLLLDVAQDTADAIGKAFGRFGVPLTESASDAVAGLARQLLPPELADWLPWGGVAPVPPGHMPRVAENFSAAKALLYERVYRGHRTTFYCGCGYDGSGRTALGSCGLQAVSGEPRAQRVEVEHLFPAAKFGNYRSCWRQPRAFPECREANGGLLSGRACCLRVDPVFIAAHNDLHNLVPAIGLVNARRSDFNWGTVSRGERFGACEIRINGKIRRAQPPAAVRGDIARTMLYMQNTYGFQLSRQDQQLYAAWNNADPPDAWEIERNRRVARLQGKTNDYVSTYRQL
jgi:deoxyribonuclease-1